MGHCNYPSWVQLWTVSICVLAFLVIRWFRLVRFVLSPLEQKRKMLKIFPKVAKSTAFWLCYPIIDSKNYIISLQKVFVMTYYTLTKLWEKKTTLSSIIIFVNTLLSCKCGRLFGILQVLLHWILHNEIWSI